MVEKVTHLTKEGLEYYTNLLSEIKGKKAIEIAKRIEIARGFGDLSENSEYDEAKAAQAMNEAERIRIEGILRNYILIDESNLTTDHVTLGLLVDLYDFEFEEEVQYYLVGSTEADPLRGKISNESPVGHALMGKKVGDIVEVFTPSNDVIKYKVLDIKIPEKWDVKHGWNN